MVRAPVDDNRRVTRPQPPSRPDIRERFQGLIEGRVSRDETDRWAAQWMTADDPGVEGTAVWWALTLLYGIDLRHGSHAPYLHSDEQIQEWSQEFQQRCAAEPEPPAAR